MRFRTVFSAVALAGVLAAAGSAGQASASAESWKPYRATNFVAPAGSYCDFPLAVTAVRDAEQMRVDARYPDGAVRVAEFRGTLVSRFTNQATGAAVLRDLSGHGWQELYPDGVTTKTFTGAGPFSAGFHTGDGFPRGYYRLDGLHTIRYAPDGTRTMPVSRGTEENLCAALS